eukprot:7348434-Prymnesium_polylepis.1
MGAPSGWRTCRKTISAPRPLVSRCSTRSCFRRRLLQWIASRLPSHGVAPTSLSSSPARHANGM